MTLISLIILAVLIPPVLFDFLFRPTIRRLGIRNVTRRVGEASLVVGGSMLASALIVASFVIGDSFNSSIREIARTKFGETDMMVPFDSHDQASAAADSLLSLDDENIDGALAITRIEVALGSSSEAGQVPLFLPDSTMMELDFVAASSFGSDPGATGLGDVATDLGPDQVVINTEVASDLGLGVGDRLEVFVNNSDVTFGVAAIVPVSGMAGLAGVVAQTGALTDRVAASSDLNTTVQGQTALESAIQATLLVSNTGDVFSGADRSDVVSQIIKDELGVAIGNETEVVDVKRQILTEATDEGAEMTELFGTIGGFSVIAGILLVINLFVMLAGERKTELGTMRALGISRGTIVRSFSLEGLIYGSMAAVLGAAGGIGVGAAVIAYARANFPEQGSVSLETAVKPSSLIAGAAIGLAISQLTVLVTSVRTTKLNIVRAIKDLPESPKPARPTRNLVLGVLALAACGALWTVGGDTQIGALAIPSLACLAVIPVAARFVSSKAATVVGCLGGLVWAGIAFSVMGEQLRDPEVVVFLLQGVLMVGLGAASIAVLGDLWAKVVSLVWSGGIAARLGMAHPLARRVRSVMLVSMFSLVLFTVTLLGIINAVFNAQAPEMAHRMGGEYEILFTSNPTAGYTVTELNEHDGVATVAEVRRGSVEVLATDTAHKAGSGDEVEATGSESDEQESDSDEQEHMHLSFVDSRFAQIEPPAIQVLAPEFADSDAAWDAVLSGGQADGRDGQASWVIVAEDDDIVTNDILTLATHDGGSLQVRVAGVAELGWVIDSGLYVPAGLEAKFGEQLEVSSRFYIQTDADAGPAEVALSLGASGPARGAEASTMQALAATELEGQNTVMSMLQGYLMLGLVIGVVGLGVVLIRAVRERRCQIGMMRALGIPKGQIAGMFVVEAFFIGFQGVVLGLGLGTLSAWQTVTASATFERGLPFVFPTAWMAGLATLALGLAMLSAVAPALRSTRESPADALRFTA